jgi:hypothetical protein
MTNLTLLVKAWNGGQLRQIDEMLHAQFEDLDVEVKILGNPINRWVKVSVEGEDEVIAAAYMRKEIGTCPVSLDAVEEGVVLKGYVSKLDDGRLVVDVGVFEPKITQAAVSLACLQTQLAGGKEASLRTIAETYAIAEGLPISIKVISKDAEGLQAELPPEQVDKLQGWQQSLLDRLIVLRASRELVSSTLERTRLERDVIDVEALGLFEYALTCKLGTDAAGLIPRVGRYMRNAVFVVFNAKKSSGLLGEQGLTLLQGT